jgi:hypothetical protein
MQILMSWGSVVASNCWYLTTHWRSVLSHKSVRRSWHTEAVWWPQTVGIWLPTDAVSYHINLYTDPDVMRQCGGLKLLVSDYPLTQCLITVKGIFMVISNQDTFWERTISAHEMMLALHTPGDGMANYSHFLKGISDAPKYILRSPLSV